MITQAQKDFCAWRKIEIGNAYMLPRFGFRIYPSASFIGGEQINTNPFTKSLDHALVEVVSEVDDFYCLRFQNRKSGEPNFYMYKPDMEFRGIYSNFLLRVFLWPFFSVYNIFKKNK